MWSVLVVEPIDVVDSSTGCMFVGLICLASYLFGLVAFEETFHWRVVIAVPFAAHALQGVAPEQSCAILQTSELRTTITVEHHPWFGTSKRESLIERGECQLRVNRPTGSPANDFPGEEVLYSAQVWEAFFGVDVSEVCEPN